MFAKKSNGAIVASLIAAVLLWGGSNAGTKYIVTSWPPVWTAATRMFCAGLILLTILRRTDWMGPLNPLPPATHRELWFRSGLTLAIYMVVFNLALRYTSAAHVALYLGSAPVWTLLWEERPAWNPRSAQRYGAAGLALAGVVVLSWPSLKSGATRWYGEVLGMATCLLWAVYGRQCRALGSTLSGAEISAHTLWRAGVMLLPVALFEVSKLTLDRHNGFILFQRDFWQLKIVAVQCYCFIGGGVLSYALWNNALRHWPTSQVFLFNNLIPLSTMTWAHFCLGERVTPTFWLAMILIVLGVVLGQARWEKVLGVRWVPSE